MNDVSLLYLDPIAVGARISVARKNIGWSRWKLAEYLGVTEQAVGRWERGETCPKIDILAILCVVLQITVGFLLTGLSFL